MKFKGTKGNWKAKEQSIKGHFDIVAEPGRHWLATVHAIGNITEFESLANATLISKAPEMLEIVKLLVDRLEELNLGNYSAVKRARKIIDESTIP